MKINYIAFCISLLNISLYINYSLRFAVYIIFVLLFFFRPSFLISFPHAVFFYPNKYPAGQQQGICCLWIEYLSVQQLLNYSDIS